MKKRSLVLSLLCFMGIIFLTAPTLAQNVDDGWVDEEVAPPAPPEKTSPPVPPPAPAPQAAWGGRWPWTSGRLIRPGELGPLSLGELELMRNEIYARHGWIFNALTCGIISKASPGIGPRAICLMPELFQPPGGSGVDVLSRGETSRSSSPGKMP